MMMKLWCCIPISDGHNSTISCVETKRRALQARSGSEHPVQDDSADRRLEGTDDDTTTDAHNRTDVAAYPPARRRQHARTAASRRRVPSAANGGASAAGGGNVTAAVVVGATLFRCRSLARGPVRSCQTVAGATSVNLRRRTIAGQDNNK